MIASRFTFQEACAYLFPRAGGGTKWSLEPTRRLLNELGNPEECFASVHIGGTNGKGSVAAMVYGALRAAGRHVGLYTSPHLVDVRERIVVDDCPISEAAFGAWTTKLHSVIEDSGASFFEATTAIACADFAARGVEMAVIEVGLGGRLDSTNALRPLVAAVTNIGIDHTEYLGHTTVEIAREKAGIAKPATPFVVGEPAGDAARVLCEVAAEANAQVVTIPADASYSGQLRLAGDHQRRNATIAREILRNLPRAYRVRDSAVQRGFATAWLPGRLDRRGRWLFDVAHNLAGVETLVASLDNLLLRRPLHIILGTLRGKDVRAMLRALAPVGDAMWVTLPVSAPKERQADEAYLKAAAESQARYEPNFDRCLAQAATGAATILVTGSFHTVGDAMSRLPGFKPFG